MKHRQPMRRWALIALLAALTGLAVPAAAAPGPPDLFRGVGPERAGEAGTRARTVLPSFDLTRPARPVTVRLNLFDDRTPVVTLTPEAVGDTMVWTGSVADDPASTVQLVASGPFVFGNAWLGEQGTFTMSSDGTGRVTVEEAGASPPPAVDERSIPAGAGVPTPSAQDAPARLADGAATIDILIVITDDVLADHFGGNTVAADTWAQARVTEFNTALANSQVVVRGALAGTAVVTYAETNNISTDLDRLTDPTDGHLDSVHSTRDEVGADIVAMVVSNTATGAGIGWLNCAPGDFCSDDYFFSVSRYSEATGFFTMSHEIGHNLGISHDIANGGTTYARGYRVPAKFATIVSYECSPGTGCPGYAPRVQYYSNPDVTYLGSPMGIPIGSPGEADAATHIDAVAGVVTAARDTPNWQPVGLVDPGSGMWRLKQGSQSTEFFFGNPGDFPFVGDWDCNGTDTPGLYRQSDGFVYLRNSNTAGFADITFFFGDPGDIPIAGDFDNDGCDTVSIYRPSNQRFYIINELGEDGGGLGFAEFEYTFGNPGDKPFVGDFDGDGTETIGLHRESTGLVYFRNTHTAGFADNQFIFGDPGDRLIAGDWNQDTIDSPAVFRPSNTTFYYRYTNTAGFADEQATWGSPTWLPVTGTWFPPTP